MSGLYLVMVWLHVLAAVVWLGGSMLLMLVIDPLLRDPDRQGMAVALWESVWVRARRLNWLCLCVACATGLFVCITRFGLEALTDSDWWLRGDGTALALKLLAAVLILIIEGLHDWWLLPRVNEAIAIDSASPEAIAMRRHTSWMRWVSLALGIAAIFFSVLIVRT